MLKIWGRANSSNVQAVMWGVAEMDLPHQRFDVGHRFGGTTTPEFLAMNPNARVPVLQDGDNPPMFESAAILRYLASRYAPPQLWPADPVARAQVDQWAEWAKLNIALMLIPVFWGTVRTPVAQQDATAIARDIAEFEKNLAIAEARLAGHAFLVGDDFTLADIAFGTPLYRYFDMNIPRTPFPAVRRYYDALCARPAYAAHVMVSYEDLRPEPSMTVSRAVTGRSAQSPAAGARDDGG